MSAEKENVLEKICINCPAGCHLKITLSPEGALESVSGNRCPRGKVYAENEIRDPRRTVTACVPVAGSSRTKCLPVRTDKALPRSMIHDLLEEIYALRLELPQKSSTVLIRDFKGSNVNVILTRGAEE